ncbi:unnamed protein product [Leptidea sinapis]|uniref:Uncharacterized protein n=1 Tax=Leptidea sinapis TaxID=189913 RepID=A0A5E4PRM1_9NEOP|nr:unnamed protein product [Leptidea sinapis]
MISQLSPHPENRKNVRRKNKNVLQDIATAKNILTKSINVDSVNRKDANPATDSDRSDSAVTEDVEVTAVSVTEPVRQTAIIEGILSPQSVLRAGESASVVFRFVRCPEGIGRITQTFPFIP